MLNYNVSREACGLVAGIFLCIGGWPTSAFSEEVSATDFLNRALASKAKVRIGGVRTVTSENCPLGGGFLGQTVAHCVTSTATVSTETAAPATVVSTRIVQVKDLKFDNTKITSLPESGLLSRKVIQNCGDVSLDSSVTLSVTGTTSWQLTKTSSVTVTGSMSTTMSASIPDVGTSGMTLSFSEAVTTSNQKMDGHSDATARGTSDTIHVAAGKAVMFELFAYEAGAEIPFTSVVVVDGDVVKNLSEIATASQLLSEAERSIPFAGSLRMSNVSNANLRTENLGGAMGCEGAKGKVSTTEEATMKFPANQMGSYLKSGFVKPALAKRTPQGSISPEPSKRVAFGPEPHSSAVLSPNPPPEPLRAANASFEVKGPSIGPPDGTSYEVLYTTEIYNPAAQCGFNDVGSMNQGVFSREARQYRTYANGVLVSQENKFADTFLRCYTP